MSDAGLASAWRGKERFVVLDAGAGAVLRFVDVQARWRRDPERCRALHFIAIEPSPPGRIEALADPWPPATPDLHRLVLEGGTVQLLFAFGRLERWLSQLDARVDAFFLDDATLRDARLCKTLARLAAPAAIATAASISPALLAGLCSAGFAVERAGDGVLARYAPRAAPNPPPARRAWTAGSAAHGDDADPVVIVGAGLAGCATAKALAEHGRASILLERGAAPAGEGSGNAVGLFHGVVHRVDGRHARFHRAAALAARASVAAALECGEAGAIDGLLRIDTRGATCEDLQGTLDRLGLPADYVRAVDAAEASRIAGTAIAAPAWLYPGGGWVDPQGLCRAYLQRAGERVVLRTRCEVESLRRDGDRWRLADADGREIARASVVVLANAGGALDLLGAPDWPVGRSRGQVSGVAASDWPAATLPRVPVSGAGYVVPAHAGQVWFGATSQHDDGEVSLRAADHRHNLARLNELLSDAPAISPSGLGGRVGFRCSANDRLPVIGAVPSIVAASGGRSPRLDQPRFVPRAPGLYVIAALGSRGIASSALGGAAIAAAITGTPSPLETDLLDAVDPARFVSRAVRRGLQPPVGPIDAGSAAG